MKAGQMSIKFGNHPAVTAAIINEREKRDRSLINIQIINLMSLVLFLLFIP